MISMAGLKRILRPLQNKIALALGRGILKLVNNAENTQRIQMTAMAGETLNSMERFQEYGFESYPLVDAEVFAAFIAGNREKGVVLCIHDRRYRPKDLNIGDSAAYTYRDKTITHRIHFVATTGEIFMLGTSLKLGALSTDVFRRLIDERFKVLYDAHTHPDPVAGNTGPPNIGLDLAANATITTKGA
jgi:hypothetical protein